MKRLLIILPILALVATGCYKEPFADAFISPNPAYVGEDVYFDNLSRNAEYVEWDFGDGYSSVLRDPVHSYDFPGLYTVTLKAFGENSGVDIRSFVVEVIGASLKIIVKEYWDEYVVPGASVILYPTYQDWLNQTNMVDEQFTNNYGECIFEGLRLQRYYVDVWEEFHDNYTLAGEEDGIKYIETQVLVPGDNLPFIAWVDYYPPGKKAARVSREERTIPEGSGTAPRPMK